MFRLEFEFFYYFLCVCVCFIWKWKIDMLVFLLNVDSDGQLRDLKIVEKSDVSFSPQI